MQLESLITSRRRVVMVRDRGEGEKNGLKQQGQGQNCAKKSTPGPVGDIIRPYKTDANANLVPTAR